jgi:hypothetical protein
VAIIGNSPKLVGRKLGGVIDRNDIVVRLNLVTPEGREGDIGSRTDVRFIGATMLDRHVRYVSGIPDSEVIVTTKKNSNFMRRMERRCIYYPARTPIHALSIFKKVFGGYINLNAATKPPRTGVVLLSLIIRYGCAVKINLYGFSLEETEVSQAIDFASAGVRTYEPYGFRDNHCDPSLEIDLLRQLKGLGAVSIVE